MNVTLKNTKGELFAEVLRLRAEVVRLRAELEAAKRPAPRAARPVIDPSLSDRMCALSRKYSAPCRIRDGAIQMYSKKRRIWVEVPADA